MISYTDDVKIISSFKLPSKAYGKIKNRASHGFIFKTLGSSEYFFEDQTVRLGQGEFIFLPEGSSYEYLSSSDGGAYTSINFNASFENPRVRVYSQEIFRGSDRIVQSFSELWNFGSASDKYECCALLCELLAVVSRYEHLAYAEKRQYALIEPAVEYLKTHIHDCELKTQKLSLLCGISDTYFRKIFAKRFHMSPHEYITAKRIADARSVLEGGDYDSIGEVAAAVGYNDPLYFSKAFKKFYGVSPSNLGNE